jgi:hypothetical protein
LFGALNLQTNLIPVGDGAQRELNSVALRFTLPNQVLAKILQVVGELSNDVFVALLAYSERG